jgi:aryl-alcohol dehydrogenase-like predicted oxidoreductase
MVIATKFGNTFDEKNKQITGSNASPEYIQRACDASLKRLKTDYIDLYQFHLNDYDPQKAEEVRDTLETLINEGKIRTYGWSTDFPDRAQVFVKGFNCQAFQFQMNVLDDAELMVKFCEKYGMTGINRGPLAMGLLTGKFRSDSTFTADDVRGSNAPSWMKYFKDGKPNSDWLQKMEHIREILTANGRTVVQGALAWILGRSKLTIPIPGFKTVSQVEENCNTLHSDPLNSSQIREINTIINR